MTTTLLPERTRTMRATHLGRAWATTWLAHNDTRDSVHYRTLIVEWHERGLQLAAHDGKTLLWSWVPDGPTATLSLADEPVQTYVVQDLDRRGLGLIRYALDLTRNQPDLTLRIEIGPPEAAATRTPALGTIVEATVVSLVLDAERVELPVVEVVPPLWRTIAAPIPSRGKKPRVQMVHRRLAKILADIDGCHVENLGHVWKLDASLTADREVWIHGVAGIAVAPIPEETDR